jgi:hypothetical protein
MIKIFNKYKQHTIKNAQKSTEEKLLDCRSKIIILKKEQKEIELLIKNNKTYNNHPLFGIIFLTVLCFLIWSNINDFFVSICILAMYLNGIVIPIIDYIILKKFNN